MNHLQKKNSNLLWIFLVIILLAGTGFGIYYFVWRESTEKQENIQYLPSEEISAEKIKKIQTDKGLDEAQATIEVLTSYIPQIKWWEINSLLELDEKIKLVK